LNIGRDFSHPHSSQGMGNFLLAIPYSESESVNHVTGSVPLVPSPWMARLAPANEPGARVRVIWQQYLIS